MLTQVVTFQQTPLDGKWLYPLLWANVVLIVVMLGGLAVVAVRFWRRWRQGAAGSRMASRLAGFFLAMALLPAAGLYAVSATSIFRGIESWFDTPLERAFEEGIAFGQYVLRQEFGRLEGDVRNLVLSIERGRSLPFWLDDLLLLYQVDNIIVYDDQGEPVVSALSKTPTALPSPILRDLQSKRVHRGLSAGVRRNLEVTMLMPNQRNGYALRAVRALPEGIDAGLAEVERGQREYENLLIARRGLRYSFMATLTLSFVFVLTVSLWASVMLGGKLLRPLSQMAAAAAAVGRGDYNHRLQVGERDDEISQLGRAFNAMVDALRTTRRQISERQNALTEANAYLESLLASMTTGVLAVDAEGRLARFNQTATEMLGVALAPFNQKNYREWNALPEIADMVDNAMKSNTAAEQQMAVGERMLVVRVRRLPPTAGGGVLVMTDDISRQIEAEREAVWEEASRRFAHEIKNPLTPIQLSAERLSTKLRGKLAPSEEELLERLSRTIINQVTAMREMVDSFGLYAGDHHREKTVVDLSAIATEVAQLYERPPVVLHLDIAKDLPQITGDAVLLRQALHNLLLNAAEAAAANAFPQIWVTTMRHEGGAVLVIEDNGGGISEAMQERAFRPYQTSKKRGTGLGLAIVHKIMDEHGGTVRLENTTRGARASLIFP